MSGYIDYLHAVLHDDLISGRRVYTEADAASVMAFLDREGADDMVPDLMLALMDRIDAMTEEAARNHRKAEDVRQSLVRLSDKNYRLEKRLEVERTRRVHA